MDNLKLCFDEKAFRNRIWRTTIEQTEPSVENKHIHTEYGKFIDFLAHASEETDK